MAIVTILSATGALLQTDTLVRAWVGSTRQLSELAARQVTEFVLLRLEDVSTSERHQWLAQIDNDDKLGGLLESSASGANSIAEISVVDATGVVLASSNRARPGNQSAKVASLASLESLHALDRVRAVWAPGREYQLRVPVGVRGESRPLFVVQVLVSNALLRETLIPGIRRIVASASLAYLVALAMVWGVAEITRRNLRRIGERIDKIGSGTERPASTPVTNEFDAVESKLTLMEGRVRGALRVETLLKALEEGIVLFEGERVVLAAGAVPSLLGWKASEVAGLEAADLFPPNASLFRLLRARWRSGESASDTEIDWAGPDGNRRLAVNIDFIPDEADPGRTLTLLRLRDAAGATEVESQLQVVSRLEAINRLTGGVAHEIKNPLNAIAARVALLESIVEGDAEAEKEIRIVADEIYRLDRVVRTFLDFTQPLSVSRDEMDIGELARGIVDLVRPDAVNRGVTLSRSGAESLFTSGDRDLLHQALLNIVMNAVEATPPGGEVRVSLSASDGSCRVRISDTGPGIPDNVKNRMFQLYFTTKAGGSGIGLAVAYRSLQLHGGDIRVETELGRGTTFEMTLPLQPVPMRQREAAATA